MGSAYIEKGYLKISEKELITLKSTRKYDKIAAEYNMYTNSDRRVPIRSVNLAPIPAHRESCLNSGIKIWTDLKWRLLRF